jgi:hypothetical protein
LGEYIKRAEAAPKELSLMDHATRWMSKNQIRIDALLRNCAATTTLWIVQLVPRFSLLQLKKRTSLKAPQS